jgi:hypothetical protein
MTADESTSVHHIETSAAPTLPIDYRNWKSRHCESELLRTEILYQAVDITAGKSRVEKLRECRSVAWFARHMDTGKVRVISNACRLRWCPICSNARSMFLVGQVHEWLKTVKKPKFLTLTMKHTNASLEHQIKWLYAHFRKFRNSRKLLDSMHGGIWFFQLKRSKGSNEWHPHLHTVIDAEYIPQAELSQLWKATTGTSSIVDIRAVRSASKVAEYVSRYCSRPAKLSDFDEKEAIEIFTVFHGRKLCGTWGTGRKVSLRRPVCTDKDKWVRIGSWRAVIAQKDTLPRAKALIRAFMTNSEFPPGIVITEEKSIIEQYEASIIPSVGIEDLHGNFEEFL